jgi:hypothetical protein
MKRRILSILIIALILPLLAPADNSYNSTTKVWEVDSTGTLTSSTVYVTRIVYFPSAVDDVLKIVDTDDELFFELRAGASDTSPVHVDLTGEGRRGRIAEDGLKIDTIDGGTAHIYISNWYFDIE